MHWYYMTQRPPMPGAYPRGVEEIEEYQEPVEIPGVGSHVYGQIGYRKPLSEKEVLDYELTPFWDERNTGRR